ncbi:MAG: LPS-assembly protein LptD [Acidisphaera sp.]|nr:LPS-assembly protein LptD [Acidisphaera sp.]MBV9813252.1 LPS-assembly protein LptD [Acetobacteraceae bacterium]
MSRLRTLAAVVLGGWLVFMGATPALAQLGNIATSGARVPVDRNAPVTFRADRVEYDRDGALITASGNVEAWQSGRYLRADRVTFDRNTNVAAASGHVEVIEPDGQTLFSDYAELTEGMRDAVLRDMRAALAENGRLGANGARRLEAQTNELSRVIYSTCNVCAQHPETPPLWDIRAKSAVQDLVNKRIEYTDAYIDLYGVPVAYLPYLSTADPSAKRASGFLVPSIGQSTHLGAFAEIPYYWVINGQQDATITPIIASDAGPVLEGEYRLRLNEGTINVRGAFGRDEKSLEGDIFATGRFTWNDTWRYGFDINRATSSTFLRDFRFTGYQDVLTSQVFVEGFGDGSYARLDARAYQGLTSSIQTSRLPYVLPRYEYSYVGEPDALGGRLSIDTQDFNVVRNVGANTRRVSLSANWDRPFTGAGGELYDLVFHVDSAAYNASQLDQQPDYFTHTSGDSAQAMPTAALLVRYPLIHSGDWGTQIVEPIVQLIGAPTGSSYTTTKTTIPNEDSLDAFNFTDANLFALNRFPGVDRLEGGSRASVALRANWAINTGSIDALIGQSYRVTKDLAFPVGSGLNDAVSDVVSHVSISPLKYFDLTSRQRFDHKTWKVNYADGVASAGPDFLRVSGGYIYSSFNPYTYFDQAPTPSKLPGSPRNEISLGAATSWDGFKFNIFARRDLELGKMVGVGGGGQYENECFIFNAQYFRRYTSLEGDHGATTLLFTITLKTVGQFGFHAS